MVYKNQNDFLPDSRYITFEQMNIITNSIKLWMEFAFWMRALIYSTIRDPVRQTVVANKLFEGVSAEFYTLFGFYYGTELAKQFMNLFTGFITGIWRLVEALKNNNREEVNDLYIKLYQATDELAAFLAQINVYYEEAQWKNFLYQAVKLAIDEATSILREDFENEVEVSSSMADLVLMIGNYMARGIISASIPNA
ncbi:MAG: hypothetical protein PHC91_09325 [Eubacteriales bacterium]|nr:hypothetical protein [Eubacteriales bacterium]